VKHKNSHRARNKSWISPPVLMCLVLSGLTCLAVDAPRPLDDDVLGPGDQVAIRTVVAKEIADKQFRIESTGEVNLPLIGRVHLAGLTVEQAEQALSKAAGKYYVNPDIAVTVVEFHSEPVSVIGAVGNPGVHEARGRKTLVQILSLAGGVRPDAGPIVTITRQDQYGPLPLPGVRKTLAHSSVADVDLKSLLAATDPTENIYVQPFDMISIPRAEMVYVVGNVKKSGGISLGGRSTISALESVALAEGFDARAAPSRARILRLSNGGVDAGRKPIPIDLSKILKGKESDVLLHPNDILYVPNSAAKGITARSVEVALQIATGILIFH
jgi:polysaccharide export outer membrane protein